MKPFNMKSVRECALLFNTSERKILELIKSQELLAVNVGKGTERPRWLIPDESLEKFRPVNRTLVEIVSGGWPKPKRRHV